MDSPCIKQTVCKVLKIFQYGKYLVAYVLKDVSIDEMVDALAVGLTCWISFAPVFSFIYC